MQTNSSHTSPTPGASTAAINAEDAAMNKSDALQISLTDMLSRPSTLRIDWDRKKVAFEFDFNDVNGNSEPVNGADGCLQNLYAIPDGASRPTLFVHANGAETGSGVEGRAQPRPCQIHEVQNVCGSAEGSGASSTGSTGNTPRCTRPLPRRNQILNGAASAAPTTSNANPNSSTTQARATYDNTNTPPASSDNEVDDDDVPLIVFKEKTVAQKRKAAAIFEPMIKVEPTEKESGKRLHPARRQFKIRNLKEHVRWYYTKSIRPIDAVPADLLKPRHESLYVHRFKVPFVSWQIWIYVKRARASAGVQAAAYAEGNNANRDGNANGNGGQDGERQDGEWRRVQIGDAHPRLKGYVLHLLDENEPRSVKEKFIGVRWTCMLIGWLSLVERNCALACRDSEIPRRQGMYTATLPLRPSVSVCSPTVSICPSTFPLEIVYAYAPLSNSMPFPFTCLNVPIPPDVSYASYVRSVPIKLGDEYEPEGPLFGGPVRSSNTVAKELRGCAMPWEHAATTRLATESWHVRAAVDPLNRPQRSMAFWIRVNSFTTGVRLLDTRAGSQDWEGAM